jgi:hypothetical protein
MNFRIKPRLPCSVCGQDAVRHNGWFLVIENRWLDRLRIFDWHPSLAAGKEVGSACCRQHLRTLIEHWVRQSSLHLRPRDEEPRAIAGIPDRDNFQAAERVGGRLVAELAVCREPFSRDWTGTREILESIVDAIPRSEDEIESYAMEFHSPDLLHDTAHELALR